MSGGTLCLHCRRGYLVAEYSKSEDKINFFCNNCFKYLEPEEQLVHNSVELSKTWGEMTDKEIEKILDDIFNQLEN